MLQTEIREMPVRRRRRFSLSIRVSALLMIAAILPLAITVISSELQSRPTLISQANIAMASDAKTRVQLIDAYFTERLLDAETLTQVPSLQAYLATPLAQVTPDLTTHAIYSLAAGVFRDKNYTNWAVFDPRGRLRLYYPLNNKPKVHGQHLVPLEDLQAVTSGKIFVSAVYFDPGTNKASVDIYAPIATTSPVKLLGFMRSTLNLDYIWNIVDTDLGANGVGSYAFILDENGVRIADTDPSRRFSAVAPLSSDVKQAITSEDRYGSNTVKELDDSSLASIQKNTHPPASFQMTPAGQNGTFQITRNGDFTRSHLPWTYFVLSPLSTVTQVADQQLLITALIACAALVLAALIGLFFGQRITRPILRSVESLRGNSEALNELAAKQRGAASEQMWVVDSSEMGLQSVEYYTNATNIAAQRMNEIGGELVQGWHQFDGETIKRPLGELISAARYIAEAARYQQGSNKKLGTAIKVTMQVSEQLAVGATSAHVAANQLQEVVEQLQDVVGV